MLSIREIVKEAFTIGCLTVETEEQLRQLLKTKYDAKDFRAFMLLQHAVVSGSIRQESRELATSKQSLAIAS
ncbi:hypothetical protein JOY44_05330 [Phormidium sp. CLA17]|uniref:hypothetical protein n=1 Tax=Leptolyngbya sp. Cla-17 TaxID=2803751 RepID=UPI001491EBA6|nr:hypothetical protein [Leptolyngbya sp. Cla-17]MBM0741044.1 hypothetical protein [Leptolyngbya sp. Cla-17]